MSAVHAEAVASASKEDTKEKGEKGPSPFLRAVAKGAGGFTPVLALWAHPEGSKTHMHGYVIAGGDKKSVIGFFNNKDGRQSISLKEWVDGPDGGEGSWNLVGYGNAVNSNKNDDPVYFDTVVFNVGETTIGARVTNACDQGLRDKIGFTSGRAERPPKVSEGEGDAEAAAPRPRG